MLRSSWAGSAPRPSSGSCTVPRPTIRRGLSWCWFSWPSAASPWPPPVAYASNEFPRRGRLGETASGLENTLRFALLGQRHAGARIVHGQPDGRLDFLVAQQRASSLKG